MSLNQDTAFMRAVRTAIQSLIGYVLALTLAVWAVPGVPHTVHDFLVNNAVQIAVTLGVPSGLAAFVWNLLRKDVPNF